MESSHSYKSRHDTKDNPKHLPNDFLQIEHHFLYGQMRTDLNIL